jgi:Tol biopolymer transport system component
MRRLVIFVSVLLLTGAVSVTGASGKPRGFNGKIVTSVNGDAQVYTVHPDGTDQRLVAVDASPGQWSPDGHLISLVDEISGAGQLLNVDSGSVVDLNLAAQYPDLFLACVVWSPDSARLACEGGFIDPSLQGVYTVRSSDGGDLRQVTSDPGGDDCPSDYSPNGQRLLFSRADATTYAMYTVKLDGSGLRQVTPPGMNFNFCDASWSPQGNEIVFSAHAPSDTRSTIWRMHTDGSGLRQLPISGCGGSFADPTSIGCFSPRWSPDGRKIVFARLVAATGQEDLYTVNADGSGLFQVTRTPDIAEDGGDWGTHPLTP